MGGCKSTGGSVSWTFPCTANWIEWQWQPKPTFPVYQPGKKEITQQRLRALAPATLPLNQQRWHVTHTYCFNLHRGGRKKKVSTEEVMHFQFRFRYLSKKHNQWRMSKRQDISSWCLMTHSCCIETNQWVSLMVCLFSTCLYTVHDASPRVQNVLWCAYEPLPGGVKMSHGWTLSGDAQESAIALSAVTGLSRDADTLRPMNHIHRKA